MRLVVDAFFGGGEELEVGLPELVAEYDGILEGYGDPAGLTDDDGVKGWSRDVAVAISSVSW